MNLREIDKLVAEKIMNWAERELSNNDNDLPCTAEYWVNVKDEKVRPVNFFNPSTNIEDAWKVWNKLNQDGFRVLLKNVGRRTSGFPDLASLDDYFCNVVTEDEEGDITTRFPTYAKTAPLSICLAGLKAVGVDVNDI